MFRKIKDSSFIEFMNMLDEVSKELDKGINVEKEKENKYSKDYNVYEENGLKHYEFMLPGFKKDDIRVELNNQNEIVITTSKLKSTRQYLEKKWKQYFENLKEIIFWSKNIVKSIGITWGEPTLDRKLPYVLMMIYDSKVKKRIIVSNLYNILEEINTKKNSDKKEITV